MKDFFVLVCLLISFSVVQANVPVKNDDFNYRLIGRVFFDGGVVTSDSIRSIVAIHDVRLGTLIHFLNHWEAKIELGYGNRKISYKDIFLKYSLGKHSIQLGNSFEPFGYGRIGSVHFRLMTNASSDRVLGNGRQFGLLYSYHQKNVHVMGGVSSLGDMGTLKTGNQGYSLSAKLIGRPIIEEGRLIHIGFAPRFSSGSESLTFSGGAPTELLEKSDNILVEANVNQVINQWKMDLELILLYQKWYFQGQYFQVHSNRYAMDNYTAKGGYAQLGYLIRGEKHHYNSLSGMMGNPAPKSMEVICRYNAVNLNDADIQGGQFADLSLGINYFINRYIAAKINYTRMMPGENAQSGAVDFDVVQARVQFYF